MKTSLSSSIWIMRISLGIGCFLSLALITLAVVAQVSERTIFGPLVYFFRPPANHLLIAQVMVDPVQPEPDHEWIALVNPLEQVIDLSNYKVGDEETLGGREGMARFPDTSVISPHQVLVIANQAAAFFQDYGIKPDFELQESDPTVPNLREHSAWAGGSIELVNSGDEVLLMDVNDHWVDAVSWGSSVFAFDPSVHPPAQQHSVVRRSYTSDTDSAADWLDQPLPNPYGPPPTLTPEPTRTRTPSPSPSRTSTKTKTPTRTPKFTASPSSTLIPSSTPSLTPEVEVTTNTSTASSTPTLTPTATVTPSLHSPLISELMINPEGEEPENEWIELYNPISSTFDLSLYCIGDAESPADSEAMYRFPQGFTLEPGQVILIAYHADNFIATYGLTPTFELQDTLSLVPQLALDTGLGVGVFGLNNTGDEVLLLDERLALVDAVSWGNSTWAFSPSVPLAAQGHSLERRPADQDTDTAADWVDQSQPGPGTLNLTRASGWTFWQWIFRMANRQPGG